MLYGGNAKSIEFEGNAVLILIFLENALRHNGVSRLEIFTNEVLILIFLENALRLDLLRDSNFFNIVLILIFLENALRPLQGMVSTQSRRCLNPYFFGKCSTALGNLFLTVAFALS